MQAIEAKSSVRGPLNSPESLPALPGAVQAFLQEASDPTLKQLDAKQPPLGISNGSVARDLKAMTGTEPQSEELPGSVHEFQGGESHAWERLSHLVGSSSRQVISYS